MKASRLLSMLLLLQTRGTVPSPELAERLEVSVRTILRDVEALSAAGVPVYTRRGRHGGVALLPGYRADVTGLTDGEANAVFLLVSGAVPGDPGMAEAAALAVQKLLAALPAARRAGAESVMRHILIEPSGWLQRPASGVDIEALKDAVLAQRRLRIRYRHSGGTERQAYTVDPYGLVAKGGVWYLVAARAGVARLFRAERISRTTVLDEPAVTPDERTLAEVWVELRAGVERHARTFEVSARVRSDILDLFTRLAGAFMVGAPGAERDGWVDVELAYGEVRGVHQLLQFGPNVQVLAPAQARGEFAAWARAAAVALDNSTRGA